MCASLPATPKMLQNNSVLYSSPLRIYDSGICSLPISLMQPLRKIQAISSYSLPISNDAIVASHSVPSYKSWESCTNNTFFLIKRTFLAWHCVRLTNLVAPVTSPDRDHRELRRNYCSSNGCGNFLRTLHPQPNVSVMITNGHKRLK